MSYSGQWDIVVTVDENLVARLANDFWSRKAVPALANWRHIARNLPLPPTPYALDAEASFDFVDQGTSEWLKVKLVATSDVELEAEISFRLTCSVSAKLSSNVDQAASAHAGTFLDVDVGAEATIVVGSEMEKPGSPEERLVLSFRGFTFKNFGLIGDAGIPQKARELIDAVVKPRLKALFEGLDPIPITPLRAKLVDKSQSEMFAGGDSKIRDVVLGLRVVSFPAAYPNRRYTSVDEARADPNRNTAISVAAAFFMAKPRGDLPDPVPTALAGMPVPVGPGKPGAILVSQRALNYLSAFVLPYEGKLLWAKAMGKDTDHGERCKNDGLFRLMLHPDTNKPIPVDNSDDETICIERINRIWMVGNRVEIELAVSICKSGFIFGAPDPNYAGVISTTYGADGDKLVTKNTQVGEFWCTDGWFKQVVGGAIGALSDLLSSVISLLQWDFKKALISFAWGVGELFGIFIYAIISFLVLLIRPGIGDQDLLSKPFEIPWGDGLPPEKIGFVGDAEFFDSGAGHNDWASMEIHFQIVS